MNFLEGKGFPLPDSMTEAQYEQILKYETKRGQTLYLDAIVEGQDQNDEALEKIMTEEKSLFQPLQVNLCQKHFFIASIHPRYDDRLFIELQVKYMKIPSSNLGRTCCVRKLFLAFRTIFVHDMFSPCSAKRRASDKDLPVQEPTGLHLDPHL